MSSLVIERLRTPNVIVTPDGQWHEQERLWNSEDDNPVATANWEITCKAILKDHKDAILVVALRQL